MPEDLLEPERRVADIQAENQRAINHIRAAIPELLLADQIERRLRERENNCITGKNSVQSATIPVPSLKTY